LLKKGRYPIAGTLRLQAGGVVLRGEGQEESGTVLVATGAVQRSLIVAGSAATRAPRNEDEDADEAPQPKNSVRHWSVTDEYVPVGARVFHVDVAEGLGVGAGIV